MIHFHWFPITTLRSTLKTWVFEWLNWNCFFLSKAGKMRVRKHLTCFCERSCRCVLRTPWGRWLCCRITCSASLLSNWCRNGESPPTPPYAVGKNNLWSWCFRKLQDNRQCSLEAIYFPTAAMLILFLKVHAELCGAVGLREPEARGPSHSEWVSEWGLIINYDTLICTQWVELWHRRL